MVVYSYPEFGAMSLVMDKTTGDEHRVIVDSYSLELIPDKNPTEKEPSIWSVYDSISEEEAEENVDKWEMSAEIVQATEKPYSSMQKNSKAPYKKLSVPLYGQEESNYCAPATAQMIAKYYGVTHTQDYIYGIMDDGSGGGCTDSEQLTYYKASNGLDKDGSYKDSSPTFNEVVSEINSNRPLKSGVSGHARACIGYRTTFHGLRYMFINDPWPVGYGMSRQELWNGAVDDHIYVKG
jgi:hypothetical protein